MTAGQFANQTTDHISEIEAVFNVRQQCGIAVVHCFPVHTVHIFEIEAVAIGAPSLVEYLSPFFAVVDFAIHVAHIHRFAKVGLAARSVDNIEVSTLHHERFLEVVGRVDTSASHNGFKRLLFDVVSHSSAARVEVEPFAIAAEAIVIASAYARHASDALGDAIDVDDNVVGALLGVAIGFLLASLLGALWSSFGSVFAIYVAIGV